MNHKTLAWLAAGVAGILSVSFGFRAYLRPSASSEESPGTRAAASPATPSVLSCNGAPNGTRCGRPEAGMRCVFDACVKNLCGDAITLGAEECDDGNRDDGDGCSTSCRWEPLPKCGNGTTDPSEQCDDGNASDADECTVRCTLARCGDGAEGPGEECDDGNLDDTDDCTVQCRPPEPDQAYAGAVGTRLNPDGTVSITERPVGGASGAGGAASRGKGGSQANGSGPGSVNGSSSSLDKRLGDAGTADACQACKERECRNFHDIDLLRGCHEAVNPTYGAPGGDGSFLQQCADLVSCSHAHECFTDSHKLAAGCYCGSVSLDECLQNGPAPDAACVPEWVAATRTKNHEEIMHRMSDFSFPSAWAFFLLECEAKNCRSVCVESESGA